MAKLRPEVSHDPSYSEIKTFGPTVIYKGEQQLAPEHGKSLALLYYPYWRRLVYDLVFPVHVAFGAQTVEHILQAGVALALSHIPVAVSKKTWPRQRPYLTLPGTNTFRNPLTDHSFPSGHTTAVFSLVTPFVAACPVLAWVLVPVALSVAVSRMYLGLHYPSDCLAGATIGTAVAAGTVALWP
jgi:membrane-associated phospholipid phosphatase